MDNQIYFWAHMLDEAFEKSVHEKDFLLTEGDHWPKDHFVKLLNKIKNSSFAWYYQGNEWAMKTDAANFIKDFDNTYVVGYDDAKENPSNRNKTDEQIHADVQAHQTHRFSNAMISYFNTVVNWFISEASKSVRKYQEFLEIKLPDIVQFLKTLETDKAKEQELRPKIKAMSLQDFEQFMQKFAQQKSDDEANKLAQQSFSDKKNEYKAVVIHSYEQMNKLYGGDKTGITQVDPDSCWCHANHRATYDNWLATNLGSIFVVLEQNGWESRHPNLNPVAGQPFDGYGESLIACLVNVKTGKLLKSTLRYNHMCEVDKRTADSAFADWADLNEKLGEDIRSKVLNELNGEAKEREAKESIVNANVAKLLENTSKILSSTIPEDSRSRLTKIDIPGTITEIGAYAFKNCNSLEHIAIPGSVNSIKNNAFDSCASLSSVVIPDSVASVGKGAFWKCISLSSATISKSLKKIPRLMFCECKSLTGVSVPDLVTIIEDCAFANCASLNSIVLPSSLKTIEQHAFISCISLKDITVPSSVTYIGEGAFKFCSALESIMLPKSIAHVGRNTFAQCSSLKKVIVPDQTAADVVLENNPEIKDKIVIKPMNETKKFSRKQIKEAIAYWERQLTSFQ